MKKLFEKDDLIIKLINIGCILSLIIVIFPLLFIAKYDYPSADDWDYGVTAYKALKSGGGIFHVLLAAFQRTSEAYLGWDGRFANGFLDSLQPGIWGERYYALTPWILIGMLIISETIFFYWFICSCAKGGRNVLFWLPIVIPTLILQILFTPSPVESFYWYTGGMNYTFMYALSLILITLYMSLGIQEHRTKRRKVLLIVVAWILSVFVGGGNFSTSLSTILILYILAALFIYNKKRTFFYKTWFIPLTVFLCLVICLISPGSIKGHSAQILEMESPLYAIWRSLIISADNISNWILTDEVLLTLLFLIPFIWKAVSNLDFSFRYPLAFTIFTFGIYASQATPNIYVYGGIGGGRVIALLYYGCILWLVGNAFYWIGWLKTKLINRRDYTAPPRPLQNGFVLLLYCCVISITFMSNIYIFDKENTSSYKAYRDWRQGLAQQYAAEWESRLEILHDSSVKRAEFMLLPYYPETLLYIELQSDDTSVNHWVNSSCAAYYDKEHIHIIDSAGKDLKR